MNTCAGSGFLVDGSQALPTDPSELDVDGLPIVGCSRLRCQRCRKPVRDAIGLAFATPAELPAGQLAALYDTADLASSPLLQRGTPTWRLYLCRCARWLETSRHACVVADPDDTDPDMAWRCDGHPALALPHDLDGVTVTSADDLRALVTRGLHDVAPPRTRAADLVRAEWIARLHARLAAPHASVVEAAALACLDDPAARTRALALRFFDTVPSDRARKRVLELVERDPRLFAGVADPVTTIEVDTTLEHTAWRILAPLVASPTRVRELARAAALAGTANVAVYDALARHDSAWLTGHAEAIARAAPQLVDDLLGSFAQFPEGVPIRATRDRVRKAIAPA